MIRAPKGGTKVTKRAGDILVDITNYGQEKISLTSGRGRMKIKKWFGFCSILFPVAPRVVSAYD